MKLLAIIEANSLTSPAKSLLEFAGLARAEGVETVIATFTRGSADNLFISMARDLGIQVEPISERGAWDPPVPPALLKLVERIAPDVVQTHAVTSHFLVRRAGIPGLLPWVAFHHGYTELDLKARAYNQLDRWSLRRARRVLTISVPFRDELTRIGVPKERIDIVHNAMAADFGAGTPEQASELRARLGIPAASRTILIVGRLSREKDHLTLLEAAARLRPQIEPHVIIVGDGPERGRIVERIARLNMTGRVALTGQQSSAAPYYSIADVAVLSSLSEGSPNALLEAMATQVPVVATNVGGIPEIVTHGESALLVYPRDVDGMSRSLARILNYEALAKKLSKRAAELIRERHSPEMRVRRLISIYLSVTGSTTADIDPFERGKRQSGP